MWFGWFGFNGGSEVAINSRAVNAVVISNIGKDFIGVKLKSQENSSIPIYIRYMLTHT